MVDALREELIT